MKLSRPFAKKTANIKNENFKKAAGALKEREKIFDELGDKFRKQKQLIKTAAKEYGTYIENGKELKQSDIKKLEKLDMDASKCAGSIDELLRGSNLDVNEEYAIQTVYNEIRNAIGLSEKSIFV